MSRDTVELIFNVGQAVARRLWDAFKNKDQAEVRRLADVLPEPLKSEVALRYQEEMARQEFGDTSG